MIYDVLIIGSGPGGYVAAIRAAQLGLKVACIEKEKVLGGTCLNVGCIPSKALLHSSELYWMLGKECEENGIRITSSSIDFPTMKGRKEKIVASFNKGIAGLFQKNKIDWIEGVGCLKGPNTVEVRGQKYEGTSILLATGSEPVALPFLPFDEKKVLSSTGALALSAIPQKLLVIGAGIIGVELGSVFSRLGSEVIFLEFLDRICPAFDLSLSKALQKTLTAQTMTFHLSHKVISAKIGPQVELIAQGPSGEVSLQGDAVLVAIGRRPYSDKLGLENVGIQKDASGCIPIDACFRTSQPHIYAIGDLVNGPMLAHKASEEGIAVAELIAGRLPSIDYASIPNVAYTCPELASVGFTEEELKIRSIAYQSGQFPFKANSRSRTTGEEEGFVKMLIDQKTQKILGVHILGAHASELIAEAALAIRHRLTAQQLAETCHAHPTLNESLKEAALAALGAAIHL